MKIIKAGSLYSNEIIHLVAALIFELTGKRLAVDKGETDQFLRQSIDSGVITVFLAFDESETAAGVITVGESGAVYAGGRFGIIHEFYISPELRSGGLGKTLIQNVKQIAIERGWKRLEVGAPPYPEWKRSKAFYLREGFYETGPRLKWVVE